ncbi:CDP-alcohol phosphatidyltransferase domain-containing protein [Trichoderma aethiopicum]
MLLSRISRPMPLFAKPIARPVVLCRRCLWATTSTGFGSHRPRRDIAPVPLALRITKRFNHQPGDQTDKSVAKKPSASPAIHEDIYTIPNFLTFTRLVASPVIGYLVLQDAHTWAVGLLAYAGFTDLLDGWIARKWNRRTVVGTIIDPMADKVLMTVLTVCLAIKGALPVWVASIILGRDVGLAIAAIYYRWISLPPPKTFTRYWDFSLPSAEVRPTTISKYNTFLQLALVGLTTAAPILGVDLASTLTVMQYVVATTTVWSGASYVFSKDAIKILNKP